MSTSLSITVRYCMDITTRVHKSFAEESKTQRGGRRDRVQAPKFPSAALRPQRALATPCAPPAVAEYLQQFSTVLVTVRIHIGGYGQQSKWEPYKSSSKAAQPSACSPGPGATAGLVGSGGELARLLEAAGEVPVASLRLFLLSRRKALSGGGGTEPELSKV